MKLQRVRGFSLIEVLVCLAIISLALFPFLEMVDSTRRAYHRSIQTIDLATEVDKTQLRITSILASHPKAKIASNNRGLTWAGGSLLWDGGTLYLTDANAKQVLVKKVQHFSVFRRNGSLVLTLELRDDAASKVVRKTILLGVDSAK